jgi:hypothetical protein
VFIKGHDGSLGVFRLGEKMNYKGILFFLLETLIIAYSVSFIRMLLEGYQIFPLTIVTVASFLIAIVGCLLMIRSLLSIYKKVKYGTQI